MNDDSLSDVHKDVSACNTKEGIHRKAMELNIAPWNLGCSCKECDRAFEAVLVEDEKLASVGKQDNVYAKQIWNEAIEAAARHVQLYDGWFAKEIRKLKK